MTMRIERLCQRLSGLTERCLSFWLRYGPDREFGGVHGTLGEQGQPIPPTHKGLVQQARHLYGWSLAYRMCSPSAELSALADGAYAFLLRHFHDPSSGEFVYEVSRSGELRDPKKVLYAQAFTLYALSEYARSRSRPDATDAALALFRTVDRRAHDAEHGGYLQADDAPWLSPGALKETNTHLHLMEALTTLYEVTADPLVAARLSELVELMTQKIVQPLGYAHQEFTRDFTPLSAPFVSYGHDLETFWLVGESARALGRATDEHWLGPVRRIAQNSAAWGFDSVLGGFFEAGPPAGAPTRLEKVWWVQAEALPALFRLFEHSGETRYLDQLEATLGFIEQRQVAPLGEWYWGILPDGSVGPRGRALGEPWKTSYHVLRALVFTQAWMRARLGR